MVEHAKGFSLPRRQVLLWHVLQSGLQQLALLSSRLSAPSIKEDEGVFAAENARLCTLIGRLSLAKDPCHRLLQALGFECWSEPVRVALAGRVVGYRQSLVVDDAASV